MPWLFHMVHAVSSASTATVDLNMPTSHLKLCYLRRCLLEWGVFGQEKRQRLRFLTRPLWWWFLLWHTKSCSQLLPPCMTQKLHFMVEARVALWSWWRWWGCLCVLVVLRHSKCLFLFVLQWFTNDARDIVTVLLIFVNIYHFHYTFVTSDRVTNGTLSRTGFCRTCKRLLFSSKRKNS